MFNKKLMQYQIFTKTDSRRVLPIKLSFHVMFKWNMSLKYWTSHYQQFPKNDCSQNKYKSKENTWETSLKESTFNKTRDITSAALREMSSPREYLKYVYLKWMTIIKRKTLEWLIPKILFTVNFKILITKFADIYR